MARHALKLPEELRHRAEQWAGAQGVSLDQFIIWAVAEKIGMLQQPLDDPRFPRVSYRSGASHWPTPVVRGTGIRVQALANASESWGMSPEAIADEYGLEVAQVNDALGFYQAHRAEIDAAISSDEWLSSNGG